MIYTASPCRALSDLEALQVHHQRAFSTQLYIHSEKTNKNVYQPIICYSDSSNGSNPMNQSWGWLSFCGCTSYRNKAQSWQISKASDVDLSLLYRTKAAAPFSVRFYTASAAGIPRSCSSWKSSQHIKCGFRSPLPGRDAQVGTLWMVDLGLNRAKVSPTMLWEEFQKGAGWN